MKEEQVGKEYKPRTASGVETCVFQLAISMEPNSSLLCSPLNVLIQGLLGFLLQEPSNIERLGQ